MPLVSIVVPVYKVEKYIHDCINSILSQSFTDFELILVDDGSPDNCGSICDQYAEKDERIRVIHQSNKGLSGARNSGMDMAQGEYITFIDSDDFVAPTYLEYLLNLLKKYEADISCVYYQKVNIESNPENHVWNEDSEITEKCLSPKKCCLELFDISRNHEQIISVIACGKLIRKSILGSLRFPEGKIHEDEFFTPLVCYKASRIAVSSAKLYYYRIAPDSIMNQSFSLKRYDSVWAIEQCIQFFATAKEDEISKIAKKKKECMISTLAILARNSGIAVPKEYKRSWFIALNHIARLRPSSVQYYAYQVSPKLAHWYEYYIKIKSIVKGNK